MAPMGKRENVVEIGMAYPEDSGAQNALRFLARQQNFTYEIFLITFTDLNNLLKQHRTLKSETKKALGELSKEKKDILIDQAISFSKIMVDDAPIIKMVLVILRHAIEGNASDIHIEHTDQNIRVRFRVDGTLNTSLVLPVKVHSAVVARIKILSNMKLDEKRKPQDGRFTIKSASGAIEVRASVVPAEFGEAVVMRVLDPSVIALELKDLGLRKDDEELIKEELKRPNGMILVTGPTGSGKTTTLYSLLTMINSPKVNIVTLEDPVEYQMNGVNQVQVNPQAGLTFASGLRSFLRQDPNIIMVGEIRDEETAQLAIQASLTGHLVFSTVHTNSSSGALPRLLDMGAEPFLLASSMTAAIGQRVLRKICDNCKQAYVPEQSVVDDVQQALGKMLDGWLKSSGDKTIQAKKNNVPFMLYRGAGCEKCGDSGYYGRIGIYEVLRVSEKIARLILERADATTIEKQAMEDGMIIMKQDGYLKVLEGITTLEEVIRVAQV